MHISKKFIKISSFIITFLVLSECTYLFAVPAVLNKIGATGLIKRLVMNSTNALPDYKKLTFKTHILPYITVCADELSVKYRENDKNTLSDFFSADRVSFKIALLPFFIKKADIKNIDLLNPVINLKLYKDGKFNFEKIFPKRNKTGLKLFILNSDISAENYKINAENEITGKSFDITGSLMELAYIGINNIHYLKTDAVLKSGEKSSDINIDIDYKTPFNYKNFEKNNISGSIEIFNPDIEMFFPYIQKYLDKDLTELKGNIDFLQLSASENTDKQTHLSINTVFHDVVYNRKNWENYIKAAGENKFNASLETKGKTIKVNQLSYKAEGINIKSSGEITPNGKDTTLDVNVKVKDSKAEKIASVLPPNLVPQYMTIQKIKKYGVYGDIEGDVNITGKIPQPDITGTVHGNNIHVLDKSIHKLHKGKVDITFDKRILNMDIHIDLKNNQKADIKGSVYIFRDGVNHVTVKTTDKIDFPLAQKIVVPVSKVFNFQLGPIPDMDIKSGTGKIDIDIQGSMDFVNINGYSVFDNARFGYKGFFGEIHNAKGRLNFEKDNVYFKSQRAFVKSNPVQADGRVTINDSLDFNISAPKAKAEDMIEIINKSELLKDVKEGIKIITKASGAADLKVNIKADIVPVPFGQPPLPPEEAFKNMKVKGSLSLLNDSGYIEGFYTPLENLIGIVDFTETIVKINNLKATSGSSPIVIGGDIVIDPVSKVPDVDITVTGDNIKLKDTIKFLTKSYLYPANYPNLSFLYDIASTHDLYFKYKAKAIDFITNKAYAVMNFKKDSAQSPLKAQSGKIILKNSNVLVENVKADLFDSALNINGEVKRVDTLNPVYNLDVKTSGFDLKNLENLDELEIVPEKAKETAKLFNGYEGFADADFKLKSNILSGKIKFSDAKIIHAKTNAPFKFDDFTAELKNNKIIIDNLTASIDDVPFFSDITISDIFKNPMLDVYFTSKPTQNFINNYIPKQFADKIELTGDINFSSGIKGTADNLTVTPKLTVNPEADIVINNNRLGEINDKREFEGNININKNLIKIDKLNYTKYISSQNNKIYPIVFASLSGLLEQDENKNIQPLELSVKTDKNLSARILNIFLKNPVIKQGLLSCDLKYYFDKIKRTAVLSGKLECRNIDIPIADTILKNIRINALDDKINLDLFGFMSDARITINSILENNISATPKIHSLRIYADQIDQTKFLQSVSSVHKAMYTNNNIKALNIPELNIENGTLEIKQLNIKNLTAHDFKSKFSIDKNEILHAENLSLGIGQGSIEGDILYDLNSTRFEGNFELNNVDSDYMAETLFDSPNQIYGNANGKIILVTKGKDYDEIIHNLGGFVYFEIFDGRMPKLGSLEYLLRASNIIKNGITGFTLNSILEILNLVKTGYFSKITGSCTINEGIADNIEIFSTGENLSLYIKGNYNISDNNANMEILGRLSKKISTIFGAIGNTSLNTFFRLIPGISLLDFSRKNFVEDVEKIPAFTHGEYDARVFQAIIKGDINQSGYVQSFKWVQ